METILNIIKCVDCKSTLNSPVFLPCGHSICKKHVIDRVESSIRCGKCGKDHLIPPDCFPENETLALLIEANIEKLDFGEVYNNAKFECHGLGNLHEKIENLLKDPKFFTYQQINNLKGKVLLKGEQLKLQIDKEMERLMEKLSRYEADCKEYSNSSEYIDDSKSLDVSLKESKTKLNKWIDTLNQIYIDESSWGDIIDECVKSQEILSVSYEELKKNCLLNIFGLMESTVDHFSKIDLDYIIGVSMDQKWDLLYRATRDGFKASDFHSKCDYRPKTLVIIKTDEEYVFGGYTDCSWDQSESKKTGEKDYIFSFRNKFDEKIKMTKYDILGSTIYCSANFGPAFGYYYIDKIDFAIADCSNTNEANFSNLGDVFSHLYYKRGSNEAKCFLAGSHHFLVSEIEVFQSI